MRSSRVSAIRRRAFSPVASELVAGAFGERLHAHRREQLVRDVELGARVEPATLAPQPLAVQQLCAGELGAHASAAQMLDRRAEPAIGVGAVARAAPGRAPRCRAPNRFPLPLPLWPAGSARPSRDRSCRIASPARPARSGPSSPRRPLGARWRTTAAASASSYRPSAVAQDRARVGADGQSDPLAARPASRSVVSIRSVVSCRLPRHAETINAP